MFFLFLLIIWFFFFMARIENPLGWKSVATFHTVSNDWTCSEVLFRGVHSKDSEAAQFSGNLESFHSVNAFWLKAKHSRRAHCLPQIFNWGKGKGPVICALLAQDFCSVFKLAAKKGFLFFFGRSIFSTPSLKIRNATRGTLYKGSQTWFHGLVV